MNDVSLGSVLLGSTNPERLEAWYLAAFAPKRTSEGFLSFGGFELLIERRDDVSDANPQPGRYIFNFHVDDATAAVAHLDEMGVTWVAPVEQRPAGQFGTLLDPDGNYVQIIELSAAYLQRVKTEGEQDMFGSTKAFSGFSVNDVPKAKEFYENVLGLRVSEEYGMLTLHIAGDRDIIVYPKGDDHVPADYTILNFPVDDIEQAVDDLTARGVSFERYEGREESTDDRGIWRGGGPLIAWFKDPAGNTFSVIKED
ncbi:MAG TPA: VOC family protein [Pseudonocardiaceae bacterium]|nr:VOC family protein [Pseudonocardiaceae bacterium]